MRNIAIVSGLVGIASSSVLLFLPPQDLQALNGPSGEGVRCLTLVGSLMLEVSALRHIAATRNRAPLDKLAAWARSAKEDKALLEGLGFNGIFREEDEGLLPWSVWEANCLERLDRFQQAASKKDKDGH